MFEHRWNRFGDRVPVEGPLFDDRGIKAGAALVVLLTLVSLMSPFVTLFGGGLVGGIVAGYVIGGPVRGAINGLLAGAVGGLNVGLVIAFIGWLVGLFLEPPTLLGRLVGPVAPQFAFVPAGALVAGLVMALFVAVDAAIGGVLGGLIRTARDALV